MYAIIDVETTGGSPVNDRVIDVAVVLFNGKEITGSYSTLVNPRKPIDKYVSNLTGITDKMVKDAPFFEDIAEEILRHTEGLIFVAHNVKFDYSMLRSEFKRMGIDYTRQQADTVNLARKAIPGFESYALGNICKSIGIEIKNRHRALGDAEATALLLGKIIEHEKSPKFIEIELNKGIDKDLLPPGLSMGDIDKLPEDAGVFYYRDAQGTVLYIEGTRNMQRKVIGELSDMPHDKDKRELYERIAAIDYEPAGNELIARLLAYREWKKHQPPFNKKLREAKHFYGIFIIEDSSGFKHMKVLKLDEEDGEPFLKFGNRGMANRVLSRIINENQLHAQFALARKMMDEPDNEKFRKSHNERIERALRKFIFRYPNCFIIGPGTRPDEHGVVWIDGGIYRGFGFYNPEITPATPEALREIIRTDDNDNEVQKIIRQQLRKQKGLKLLNY